MGEEKSMSMEQALSAIQITAHRKEPVRIAMAQVTNQQRLNVEHGKRLQRMTQKKAKAGRPSKYSPELADFICKLIVTQGKGIGRLCKEYDELPTEALVFKWILDFPEFGKKYRAAKALQSELLADEIEALTEVESHTDNKGVERVDPGMVALAKLKVDTRKWHAARLAPRVYGPKSILDEGNDDAKNLVSELIKRIAKEHEREY